MFERVKQNSPTLVSIKIHNGFVVCCSSCFVLHLYSISPTLRSTTCAVLHSLDAAGVCEGVSGELKVDDVALA